METSDTASLQYMPKARGLTRRLALLTAIALALVGVSIVVQEIQATSTAWIVGQSHWSRGQQRAVAALERYVDDGREVDLAEARSALAIPLGDMHARLALEQDPPDPGKAREGFEQGGNDRRDIGRLVLSYRYGRDLPIFSASSRIWRRSDAGLLELQAMADVLEQAVVTRGALDEADRRVYRQRLQALDNELQAMAAEFSAALREMAGLVRLLTLAASMLSVLAITLVAVLLARRVRFTHFEQESRFRAAFHQAHVGMLKLDPHGQVLEANQALADILHMPHTALLASNLAQLLVEGEMVFNQDGSIDWRRQLRPSELRFRRSDGGLIWGRWSGTMVPHGRRGLSVFAIVEDVSHAHALAREVAHQASHDPLTGLANRHEVEQRLERALVQLRGEGGLHALCHFNLDHFKLVNDSAGHDAGDQILRVFAEHLESAVRESDWVGRLGADEFALFLAGTTQDGARRVAQRVVDSLGQVSLTLSPDVPTVSCSVGVLEFSADAPDVNWVLSAADSACYAAKQGGRNRVHCFNENRMAVAERRQDAARLRRVSLAIAENRLVLFAQRIEHPRTPGYLHYEVLVRLRDPDGTVHGPAEFIAAVERYGMGMALDRCVLSQLFRYLQQCPAHVKQLGLCNVNVSAQSITEPAFLAFVSDLLERHRSMAGRLCLEITETAVIHNLPQARRFIDAVKARGCRIALDDFGSGLSSFGYLRELSADLLKIDGAFVRDMETNPVSRATVRAIAALGRELDLQVVAEWVETEAAARALADMGVQGLQGHAIAWPQPLEELLEAGPCPERQAPATGVEPRWRG